MTLLDQFGLPQDMPTSFDPTEEDSQNASACDREKELQDLVLKFATNEVDENRTRLFSRIVNHAILFSAEEHDEPQTFGLKPSEIKAAKKEELSFNPARERDLITLITSSIYNTQIWQPSQSRQPAEELAPLG